MILKVRFVDETPIIAFKCYFRDRFRVRSLINGTNSNSLTRAKVMQFKRVLKSEHLVYDVTMGNFDNEWYLKILFSAIFSSNVASICLIVLNPASWIPQSDFKLCVGVNIFVIMNWTYSIFRVALRLKIWAL